jgi:hypothetical protein
MIADVIGMALFIGVYAFALSAERLLRRNVRGRSP